MQRRWQKVGIIAGGGDLPVSLANGCAGRGEPYFVLRLTGFADSALETHPGADCGIAEMGRAIRLLKEGGCDAVTMAGLVRRPNFAALRPDWRGAALLPKVVTAARRGDGALLDVLVETFGAEGFTVLGPEELTEDLWAPAGPLGQVNVPEAAWTDIRKANKVVEALGPYDVGQGAVVRNGLVLAVEAAEGTDAMLRRVSDLPDEVKGFEPGTAETSLGVLVKRPKPEQELRVDLPTIGQRTVRLAHAAGLSGIVYLADHALIVGKEQVVSAANETGLFVYGMTLEELS